MYIHFIASFHCSIYPSLSSTFYKQYNVFKKINKNNTYIISLTYIFSGDNCQLSPDKEEMQILLNICNFLNFLNWIFFKEFLKEPKAKKSRVIIDSDSDIDENSNLSSTNSKREKINKVVSSEEEEKNSSKEEKAKKKSKSSNKKAKKEKKEKKDRKEDQERDNIHDDDYYNKSDCGSSNSGSDDDDTNLTEKESALRESV